MIGSSGKRQSLTPTWLTIVLNSSIDIIEEDGLMFSFLAWYPGRIFVWACCWARPTPLSGQLWRGMMVGHHNRASYSHTILGTKVDMSAL